MVLRSTLNSRANSLLLIFIFTFSINSLSFGKSVRLEIVNSELISIAICIIFTSNKLCNKLSQLYIVIQSLLYILKLSFIFFGKILSFISAQGENAILKCVADYNVLEKDQNAIVNCVGETSVLEIDKNTNLKCVAYSSVLEKEQNTILKCVANSSVLEIDKNTNLKCVAEPSVLEIDRNTILKCVADSSVLENEQNTNQKCVAEIKVLKID